MIGIEEHAGTVRKFSFLLNQIEWKITKQFKSLFFAFMDLMMICDNFGFSELFLGASLGANFRASLGAIFGTIIGAIFRTILEAILWNYYRF